MIDLSYCFSYRPSRPDWGSARCAIAPDGSEPIILDARFGTRSYQSVDMELASGQLQYR